MKLLIFLISIFLMCGCQMPSYAPTFFFNPKELTITSNDTLTEVEIMLSSANKQVNEELLTLFCDLKGKSCLPFKIQLYGEDNMASTGMCQCDTFKIDKMKLEEKLGQNDSLNIVITSKIESKSMVFISLSKIYLRNDSSLQIIKTGSFQ